MEAKPNNAPKREVEQTIGQHRISRIVGNIKTLLLNSSISVQRLKDIYKSLTYQNLIAWNWPYKDYYFSGKNPIIPRAWFEAGTLDMFKDIGFLENILARETTINFDWNENIRNEAHKLAESFIQNDLLNDSDPIIDVVSKNNLTNAFIEAQKSKRKIVFISNHASHFDTIILSCTLSQLFQQIHNENSEIPIKKIRFVCGAYMYYNKWVRNSTHGFDTMFVFGPKDLKEIMVYLRQNKQEDIFLRFNAAAVEQTEKNSDVETTLLFPYAWRSESKNGCKDELPKRILQYIESPNCLYVPLWSIGSDNIFSTGDLYQVSQNIDIFEHIKNIIKYLKFSQIIKLLNPGADQKQLFKLVQKAEPIGIVVRLLENLDIFKLFQFLEKYKFKFFKPGNVNMTIWEYFVWWEKTLEEINQIMHFVSNDALDKNQKNK